MSNTKARPLPSGEADFKSAVLMAETIHRLEADPSGLDAHQYQILSRRLGEALVALGNTELLRAICARYPVARDIYENQQYEHAGLCLHDLSQAMNAEGKAREVLARVAANP